MKEIEKQKKQNMKIYSLYRMLSVDHIFVYAIDFIFLTQIKNISAADIVLGQAFYAFFVSILQILAIFIIDKLGNKKSMILSNLFIAIHILIIMNCKNINYLVFAQFIDAIGFSIKDIADNSLLNYSIPKGEKKGEIFSKIEGNGVRKFHYFSAISAIIAGAIYNINVYIPFIISFIISLLSAIIALGFNEVREEKNILEEELKISGYITNLRKSFKFIFKSKRLKALLIYSGIYSGIFWLMNTYIVSLLEEMGAVATIIAGFTFLKSIATGVGTTKQLDFHNKFENKSISKILFTTFITILIIGLIGIIKGDFLISVIIITLTALVMFFVKGVNDVLSLRYLQNFTNEKILTKIYSINAFARNFSRIIISFIGSCFLRVTNTANSVLLIGILFGITIFVLINYMKTRVGLKPEEYDEKELKFDI